MSQGKFLTLGRPADTVIVIDKKDPEGVGYILMYAE
jgi:hypothetical protein